MSGIRRSKSTSELRRRRASGQAAVMTLLFTVALVIVMLTLYRTGRLTSDKMELQNAADAMAVSVSKIEARDLNFAAYTNRAMVANEVAIGQAMGIASWAFHHESIGQFLQAYDLNFLKAPTLGASTAIVQPIANIGFQIPGSVAQVFMGGYARAMSTINYFINQAYGVGQQIYHVATLVNSFGLYQDLLRDNAPDGAQLSAYGTMMLISHLATYGSLPTSGLVDRLPAAMQSTFAPFTKSFDPGFTPLGAPSPKADLSGAAGAGSNTQGYGRFAAIVKNSGDPFTKGYHNPPHDFPQPGIERTGRGWTLNFFALLARLGIIPNIPPLTLGIPPFLSSTITAGHQGDGWLGFGVTGNINVFGLAGANFNYSMALRFALLRQGGSELRMMVPLAGRHRNQAAGQFFSWSSADTLNFDLGFRSNAGISAWFMAPSICGSFPGYYPCFRRVTLNGAQINFQVANNQMNLGIVLPGISVIGVPPTNIPIYNGYFPTRAPLGAAITRSGSATRAKPNEMTAAPKHAAVDIFGNGVPGPIPKTAYGRAPENDIAWNHIVPAPPLGIFPTKSALPNTNVGRQYRGLPPYLDSTGNEGMFKSGGPLLIIGLTMDEDTVETEHYDENPGKKPVGQFNLNEGFACNAMSAVAKSEVYFKRPLGSDLSYFGRKDNYEEHGSAFNPYWQARLVETSHADRVMSLFLEHREIAQTVPGQQALLSVLNPLLQFLTSALGQNPRLVGC